MKVLRVAVLILTALTLASMPLFAADPPPEGGQAVQIPPDKVKRFVATPGSDGVQHVEIIGGEYYFDPNHIVVKINMPVELLVKKTPGYVPHNIIVKAPEAGIDFKVDMGKEPQPIRFTPTKAGRYPMYCDHRFLWFKTHQAKGMEGIIEVVE